MSVQAVLMDALDVFEREAGCLPVAIVISRAEYDSLLSELSAKYTLGPTFPPTLQLRGVRIEWEEP
jgi:hypothetical protein